MRIRIKRHASPSYRICRTQLQKEVYFVIVIPYILLSYSLLQCSRILPTQKPIRQGEIKIDRYTGERENRKTRTNRERESMKCSLFRHGALTQLSQLLLLFLAGCVRRSLGGDCEYSIDIKGYGTVDFAYVTECNDDNYNDMCSDTYEAGSDMSSCLCNNVFNNDLPTYYVCTGDCGTWDESVKSKDVDGQCVQ